MRICGSCSAPCFRTVGYHAIPAVDGMNALEVMDKSYIDLIVADIMISKMDGL